MAASAHRRQSSSSSCPSLPSSSSSASSSSPSSSSASIPAPSVLDLADHLWFYRSVLPLPALPCLPFFSRSPLPDTSTLLAQCMRDRSCSSPGLVSSPFPPPSSSLDLDRTNCNFCYLPPPSEDTDHKNGGHAAFDYPYSSLSESDDDEEVGWYRSRPAAGEDEEAFHYYSATSDLDEEEAYKGYLQLSDLEDEPSLHSTEPPAHLQEERLYFEPQDALSGIYDVASLLKHQVPSYADQADMKESLRAWAHAVALTLPWKAAANARPLL